MTDSTTTHATLLTTVRAAREASDNNWSAAIDGEREDGETAAQYRAARERTEGHYDAAIEAIAAGDLAEALEALDLARRCESEGGDDGADAQHAIAAVRAALAGVATCPFAAGDRVRTVGLTAEDSDSGVVRRVVSADMVEVGWQSGTATEIDVSRIELDD